ncbi:MAG: OadG family protein, partial [Bacteroidota bacterium]
QIEIVIVGGAILFLTQIPDFFLNILAQGQEGQGKNLSAGYILGVYGGLVFSRALLISFILNLLLRAIWLGYLAIKFSYPEGINFQKLRYSEYFQKKIQKEPETLKKVLFLEKMCSLTYAMGIMMTIMAVGIFVFLIILSFFLHYFIYALYRQEYFLIFLILGFLFVLGLFDFLFFGVLKKQKWLNRIYYPIHRFFSIITLNFLYRREWLTLSSQGKRWGLALTFFIYFLLAFLIAEEDIYRRYGFKRMLNVGNIGERREFADFRATYARLHGNFYLDKLQQSERVERACIQSISITEKHLRLFVLYRKSFDVELDSLFSQNGFLSKAEDFKSISRQDIEVNDEKFQQSLADFFRIKIDKEEVKNLNWYFHKLPETNQEGFTSFIPIDSLPSGEHKLSIDHLILSEKGFSWGDHNKILFIKE